MSLTFMKKSSLWAALSLAFVFHESFAWENEFISDARSVSLGNIQLFSEELSNPSCLSFIENSAVHLTLNNRFQIEELNTVKVSAVYHNRFLDTGFSCSEFGFETYKQYLSKLGFSKKIHKNLSLGGSIIYQYESFFSKEPEHRFSGDFSFYYELNKQFTFSLLNRYYNQTKENFLFLSGINYCFTQSSSILVEYASDFRQYNNLRLGIEYELLDAFFVRTGLQTLLKQPSFGVGYTVDLFTFDIAFEVHSVLGTSSTASVTYNF